MSRAHHPETHKITIIAWLRAGVLGANDGIISTACLILGVAATNAGRNELLVAGIAALTAGAMSMAAGEYVSVSSQADAERADIEVERQELKEDPVAEHRELTAIYMARGVSPELASRVADELMGHDALGAHLQDELGIRQETMARPLQAALASACTFAFGAALPLLTTLFVSTENIIPFVAGMSLLCLVALGVLGAYIGAAPLGRAALRVGFWGALAMAITTGIGKLFGILI